MSWLDILFPPTCVACGAGGSWLCDGCRDSISLFHLPQGRREPFASVLACGAYADPVLRTLVTSLKYRSARCLAPSVSAVLSRFRNEFGAPWPWAGLSAMTVTSVPSDSRRKRKRGLDHAALIADAVQQTLVPWAVRSDLLARTRSVPQNANLPADATRAANVLGAFRVAVGSDLSKPVLLVDDVTTTGATAAEAARILLAAGVPSVHLFVLASGG